MTQPTRAPSESPRLMPRAFVSYAHDSAAHKRSVRRFCELLAKSGIVVSVDYRVTGERRDWQLWATSQILESDFVIVIASPACKQVGDGTVTSGTHAGLQSEMRTLRELYHSDPAVWTTKMLPVVLPGRSVDEIPLFLQPRTADHFVLRSLSPAGARALIQLLSR